MKTQTIELPLPALEQKVEVVKPFDTCMIAGIPTSFPLPVGTIGQVVEVMDGPQGLCIGINIETDTEELQTWREGYNEATGNDNTVYLYDGTAFTHNGVQLTAAYEFHLHFKHV